MLLGEPPATQADLHFRLFGIPVRVHPFFWIVALILGMGGLTGREAEPLVTLLWVVAMFVSILVHELGHAFMQRYYGGHPWITLVAMGGMASCDDCDRSPTSQIIIAAAGPAAGFLFAAAVYPLTTESIGPNLSRVPWILVQFFLWINVVWGAINLLPIYPLDGGRIARELFTIWGNPHQGIVRSLWLSVVCAAGVAVWGLSLGSLVILLMFGYLAYLNYQSIQAYQGYGTGREW